MTIAFAPSRSTAAEDLDRAQRPRLYGWMDRLACDIRRVEVLDRMAVQRSAYDPMSAWSEEWARIPSYDSYRTEWTINPITRTGVVRAVSLAARMHYLLSAPERRPADPTLRNIEISVIPSGEFGGIVQNAGEAAFRERVEAAGLAFVEGAPLLYRHDREQVLGEVLAVSEPRPSDRAAGLLVHARLDDPAAIEALVFGDPSAMGASFHISSVARAENGMREHSRSVVSEVSLTGSPATMLSRVQFAPLPKTAISLRDWNRRAPQDRRHPSERAAEMLFDAGFAPVQSRSGRPGVVEVDCLSTEPGNTLPNYTAGIPRGTRVRFADGVEARI